MASNSPFIKSVEPHAQLIKLTFADWLDMPPVYYTERQIMEATDDMRAVVFALRRQRA